MLSPVEQAKNHMLSILKQAGPQVTQINFPCLAVDAEDFHRALALPEVLREFERRRICACIQPIQQSQAPEIAIATIDDVASGKLDNLLGK